MANIYCFISDEPFLLQENRLIEINKLKKEGYLNRKIFFVDKKDFAINFIASIELLSVVSI